MERLVAILRHWLADGASIVRPIEAGRGFSGARHWQVEFKGRLFVLRQWPFGVQADRLTSVHAFQQKLAVHELPVPMPMRTRDGETFVKTDGQLWELAAWMPGEADYWRDPRPEKLSAALRMLARIHVVSRSDVDKPVGRGPLQYRIDKLSQLVHRRDLHSVQGALGSIPADEREQAKLALDLVGRMAQRELVRSERWRDVELPAGMCLRDIWHDHVLFTGDEVSGVIDFGAAEVSAPAADIARLLGSMVGDDPQRWAAGLAAYETVRPLSDDEREAVGFFDATGVVLSTANWLEWFYGASAPRLAGTFDRAAALGRFNILAERLRTLADANR